MKTAFRILKAARIDRAFTGECAAKVGGRWNSVGVRVVYLASSRALGALELLVHLDSVTLPSSFVCIPVSFQRRLVETLDHSLLPSNWSAPDAPRSQALGDEWVASKRSLVFEVPSAIIPHESNFLLNPQHPAFQLVTMRSLESFQFDPRLL